MTTPEAPASREPRSRKGLGCLGWALAFFATMWVVWIYTFPTYPARYRLTVEVETPQGLKTGSSVIEARYGWRFTGFGLTSSVSNSFAGEAVFIDLGDGRNLVVTLTNWSAGPRRALPEERANQWENGPMDAVHVPSRVYDFHPHDKTKTPQGIRRAKAEGPKAFDPAILPTTVTFPDLDDPASVQGVDPTDLEATFGPGYRVRRAMVEMTDAPLTRQIGEKLKWLPKYYSKMLDGSSTSSIDAKNRIANSLTPWAFKKPVDFIK